MYIRNSILNCRMPMSLKFDHYVLITVPVLGRINRETIIHYWKMSAKLVIYILSLDTFCFSITAGGSDNPYLVPFKYHFVWKIILSFRLIRKWPCYTVKLKRLISLINVTVPTHYKHIPNIKPKPKPKKASNSSFLKTLKP